MEEMVQAMIRPTAGEKNMQQPGEDIIAQIMQQELAKIIQKQEGRGIKLL